jgi:hypothetical protein
MKENRLAGSGFITIDFAISVIGVALAVLTPISSGIGSATGSTGY